MKYEFSEDSFFLRQQLAPNLWRVTEHYGGPQRINIYVITGTDKTVVVDSGLGVTKGLRRYIEEHITQVTPMVCYMTHGHPDHCGGSPLFDEMHMHEEEWPALAWNMNNERRIHDAAAFAYNGAPGHPVHGDLDRALAIGEYCEEHCLRVNWKELHYLPIRDGEIIDLGNTTLECIYFHAHGSMLYYNPQEHYVLMGDNTTYTLGVGPITQELAQKFEKLLARFPEDTMFYTGHTFCPDLVTPLPEIDMATMRKMVQGFYDILNGVNLEQDEDSVFDMPTDPRIPTLAGHVPDPEDEDGWAAYYTMHPKRPDEGDNPHPAPPAGKVHMAGPIQITYHI